MSSPMEHQYLLYIKQSHSLDVYWFPHTKQTNKQTKADRNPIPWVYNIIDRLTHARVFSKIDPNTAYHQVMIDPSHKYKMALLTTYRQLECLVLPFG